MALLTESNASARVVMSKAPSPMMNEADLRRVSITVLLLRFRFPWNTCRPRKTTAARNNFTTMGEVQVERYFPRSDAASSMPSD
jgi:hypothetical protein